MKAYPLSVTGSVTAVAESSPAAYEVLLATDPDVERPPLREAMLDVLNYVSLGYENVQIGEARFTSENTVKNQRREIYRRLGARNGAHAVRLGFELDYLESRGERMLDQPLSPSEERTLVLGSFGCTQSEIAYARGVAFGTVHNQYGFLEKMGVVNLPEAVRVGFEAGILHSSLVPRLSLVPEVPVEDPPHVSHGLLSLVARGLHMAKIDELFERPMRSEMKDLIDQLGARDLAHAVRLGHQTGLLGMDQDRAANDIAPPLPPQQQAELTYASFGIGTAQAAEITGLSENTHKNHRRTLRMRLAASGITIAGVVHRGFEARLLTASDNDPSVQPISA